LRAPVAQNSASAPASAPRSRAVSAPQTATPAAISFWYGCSLVPSYQKSRPAAVPLSYFMAFRGSRHGRGALDETWITLWRRSGRGLTLRNSIGRDGRCGVTSTRADLPAAHEEILC